jgi:hypothetical protein
VQVHVGAELAKMSENKAGLYVKPTVKLTLSSDIYIITVDPAVINLIIIATIRIVVPKTGSDRG